ncbi:MAG: hypothetical protein ACREOQ_00555 [Gemmatimonadales bacterium]
MNPTTLFRWGGLIAALLAAPAARSLAQGDSARAGRPVPTALAAAGEHGENLYDAAKAKAWRTAGRRLKALEADVAQLGTQPDADRLQDEVDSLRQSVARRQRQATMVEANQVTRIVADLTAPYAPKVPVEVTRLDFYGRELEIGSETGAAPRLESAVRGIRHEWDAVRPAMSTRDSLVARKFDGLVTRIERARSPAEYRRLAEEELAEVDDLEHVFER